MEQEQVLNKNKGCVFCRIRMQMCAVGVLDSCTKKVVFCVAELKAMKGHRCGGTEIGNPEHWYQAWR